jgi:AraC-like DNA-binding protein
MADRSVSAGLARSLFEYASAKGAGAVALAERSGIDPRTLEDHDSRVPFDRYVALMRAAKDLCGDPALPLHFGEATDMAEFSIVGLLANASETMAEAMLQLNRYGQLVVEVDIGAGGRFANQPWRGGAWLVDTRPDPDAFLELTESTFARMVCGPRRFLPRPYVLEVHVTHPEPGHSAEYDRTFQCPVVFGSHWNALRIDLAMTSERVAQQPRYVFGVLSEHADALLKSLESSKTVKGRVESLLMPILHTGEANIDKVAGQMAMSRQTLFRRLKAEGVTFAEVLDDLRHRLALHYLGGRKVSVNETAYLVGFSEPAAFSRAFKRWTGMSPKAARNGLSANAAA